MSEARSLASFTAEIYNRIPDLQLCTSVLPYKPGRGIYPRPSINKSSQLL